MKVRLVAILTIAGCAVGLAFWLGSPAALAQDKAGADKYAYVGSKACKKCHIKLYKSWEKTKSAKAFDSLKAGEDAEIKTKHGLDPAKDYTKDESCLKCHVVGFGAAGGYATPDAADKKAVKKAATLEGVGCEACHGPGEKYCEVFKEIQKSKRKYNVDELYAVGLKKMDASACTNCHNDKSPTFDKEKGFDFKRDKETDTHVHEELKQREG